MTTTHVTERTMEFVQPSSHSLGPAPPPLLAADPPRPCWRRFLVYSRKGSCYAYKYTCMYTYIYICAYAYVFMYIYIYMYMCLLIYCAFHVHIQIQMYNTSINVKMHIHTCICKYTYINTHTHTLNLLDSPNRNLSPNSATTAHEDLRSLRVIQATATKSAAVATALHSASTCRGLPRVSGGTLIITCPSSGALM